MFGVERVNAMGYGTTIRNTIIRKELLYLGGLGLILFFTIVFCLHNVCKSEKYEATNRIAEREKIVTSVLIEKDSSLWDIATQYYTDEYADIHAMIKEIKKSNGLEQDTIHAGAYVIVPHYVSVGTY